MRSELAPAAATTPCGPVPSTRPVALSIAALLAALLLFAAIPVEAHTGSGSHPHLDVEVNTQGAAATTGTATITWTGPVTVQERDEERFIDLPAPAGTTTGMVDAVDTTNGTLPGNGIASIDVALNGTVHVRWSWAQGAPEAGSTFDAARLRLTMPLEFAPDARIAWPGGLSVDTAVTLRVPDEVAAVADGGLKKAAHSDISSSSYSTIALAQDHLHIDLRPTATGPDPGRAHPAWAGWGWAIVIGVGTTSGLIWWAGHRADERRSRENDDA